MRLLATPRSRSPYCGSSEIRLCERVATSERTLSAICALIEWSLGGGCCQLSTMVGNLRASTEASSTTRTPRFLHHGGKPPGEHRSLVYHPHAEQISERAHNRHHDYKRQRQRRRSGTARRKNTVEQVHQWRKHIGKQ